MAGAGGAEDPQRRGGREAPEQQAGFDKRDRRNEGSEPSRGEGCEVAGPSCMSYPPKPRPPGRPGRPPSWVPSAPGRVYLKSRSCTPYCSPSCARSSCTMDAEPSGRTCDPWVSRQVGGGHGLAVVGSDYVHLYVHLCARERHTSGSRPTGGRNHCAEEWAAAVARLAFVVKEGLSGDPAPLRTPGSRRTRTRQLDPPQDPSLAVGGPTEQQPLRRKAVLR